MVAGKKKERKGKKIKIKHPASYFFFLALQALFPSVLQCNYHTAVAYLGNKKASAKEKKVCSTSSSPLRRIMMIQLRLVAFKTMLIDCV